MTTAFAAFPKVDVDAAFTKPAKLINSEADVARFLASVAFDRIVGFLLLLNESVKGKSLDEDHPASPTIQAIGEVLDVLVSWIDEIPPSTGPRRFGNVAFRQWMQRLEERGPGLLRKHLPDQSGASIIEIAPYFTGGFGSGQRLDYGTGHELSFASFLCTLFLLRILDPSNDSASASLVIFPKYLSLIRRLVETYTLEPAGSHGVWGLDDTSFLPFLLGSGQLKDQSGALSPASIMQPDILQREKNKNLYFAAIAWINKIKRGPFYEHSPTLYDISAVPYWAKINQGMIKMYKVEVLGKFPVIQHFPLGSVFFTLDEAQSRIPAQSMAPPSTHRQR